jgi:hypothetical protein
MVNWLQDIFIGALGSGVNFATLVAVNVVTAGAFSSLLFLLFASYQTNPSLVPHVYVQLFFALGLWASINWFVMNMGLADSSQQSKELFGTCDQDSKDSIENAAVTGGVQQDGQTEEKKIR